MSNVCNSFFANGWLLHCPGSGVIICHLSIANLIILRYLIKIVKGRFSISMIGSFLILSVTASNSFMVSGC